MTSLAATPLSVLDSATVAEGSSVGDALRNSIDLAQHAERLGFRRYWVAEHHNMPGIASSAPAVLIAHIAQATSTIRVGSGGVMLPNHSPLAIAEQFGTLEALHPGRIDLGLGRAPGSDQLTAYALRRSVDALAADDFPDRLNELISFFRGEFAGDDPLRMVTAVPGLGDMPEIWLLGSSLFGAQLAGLLGIPFAFAHHFSAANTLPALAAYRSHFRASRTLERAHSMIAVSVICAETDERAQWLAGSGRLSFVRQRTGKPGRIPSPEEAERHQFDDRERAILADRGGGGQIVGGPKTVLEGLERLLDETRVDELMITTRLFAQAERIRTYERVAELAGIGGASRARA